MFFNKIEYFLVADVGGTKTDIAVIDSNKNILLKKNYSSKEITDFTNTLQSFTSQPEYARYNINMACIAVAGQVIDGKEARPTNLNLTIESEKILIGTSIKKILLINDFEAIGYIVDKLKPEQYVEITGQGRNTEGTIAIIGAGTGLGVSILPYSKNAKEARIPMISEGGHIDFPISASDKLDVNFQLFLIKNKKYKDAEDIVSGKGIINIYKFLLTQKKIKHDSKIKKEINDAADELKPSIITKYALEDKDALCILVLELFIKYYSRIARNLALTTMCSELVLAGGIAPKIVSALQDIFYDEFVAHDNEKMRKLLETISIIVVTDINVGLYGAFEALKHKI